MASEARYRLLVDDGGPVHPSDFRRLGCFVSLLPSSAFTFCVVYSIIYNFEHATATQCKAYNVLPSISAAIGEYSPQKEVWKLAILIHAPFRFFILYLYVNYNLQVLSKKAGILILIAAILNFVEIVSLISLSMFDSSNYYPIHEKSFITFILSSELYMLLLICMQSYRMHARNLKEAYSLKLKKLFAVINIAGIILAMYFYVLHNTDCPNFAYTKFAICEYIVVFSNILYHLTAVYDFQDKQVVVRNCNVYLR